MYIKEENTEIEVKNPGVLEVPKGKNVEDLPIKHFVNLANKKGLATVTKALNNLQVWNKNKNKPLSKWARDMIDKVTKRVENQKKNESLMVYDKLKNINVGDYNMIIKEIFSRDYIDNCIADMETIGYEYNGTDNRGRLVFDSKDGNSTQAFPDWEDVRNYLDNGATPFDLDAYLKKDVNECDKLTIKEENSSKADDIDFVMNKYVDNKPVSGRYGSYDKIEIIDNKGNGKYTVSCNGYSVDIDFDLNDDSAQYVYYIEGEGPYAHNSYEYITKDIAHYIDWAVRHFDQDDDLDESQCLTENSLPDWQDTIMIEIRNILKNNRIYADIYDDTDFRGNDDAFVLCVEIENGDWKHEHKRADILITDTVNHYDNMEITKIGEETIGDSEDDTYSSIHKFHILRYLDDNGFDFDDIEQLDIKFPTKESKNRSKRNKKRVNEARYSDVVPYENRKYWYFTTHGIGPGTIPRGVKVLDVKEGQNKKGTWGDFICLDAVLNTSELKEFDLIELAPDNVYESNNNRKAFKVGDKVNSKLTAANISFNDATIIDIDRNGLCTIECADGTIIDGIKQDRLVKSYKKESKSVKESIYTDNGFKNRAEYLQSLADDFGVDINTVKNLADMLGAEEDFDGLVSQVEDIADELGNDDEDIKEGLDWFLENYPYVITDEDREYMNGDFIEGWETLQSTQSRVLALLTYWDLTDVTLYDVQNNEKITYKSKYIDYNKLKQFSYDEEEYTYPYVLFNGRVAGEQVAKKNREDALKMAEYKTSKIFESIKKSNSKPVKESIDLNDYKFKFSTKDGYKVYSKFDKSLNKGLWVAQKDGEEPFEISYEQARGFEPINPTNRALQHKVRQALKMESKSIKEDYKNDLKKFADANKDKLNQLAQKNGFRLYNDYYYRNTTVDRDYTSVLCFDFDELNSKADIDKFERALDRYFGKFDYRYFLELLPRVKRICIYY